MRRPAQNLGWLLCLTLMLGQSQVAAQQLQIQRGPYYVGEAVTVQVTVQISDASEDEQPTCVWSGSPQADLQVEGPSVSPQFSSRTTVVFGRVETKTSATYRFTFAVTSSQPGEKLIGPFEVTIDGKTSETDSFTIAFEALAADPDMHIELDADFERIYVGQRIPAVIRWSFSGNQQALQTAFRNLEIRSPIFEEFDLEIPTTRTQQTLSIATPTGNTEIDATAKQIESDGEAVVVVEGKLNLVARQPKKFENVPFNCRTQRLIRVQRSFFGDRSETAPAIAAAEPMSFEVLPLPVEGRPSTFSGAIGEKYSIEAVANRSDVRVGDPITLDVKLRGDGYLNNLSLPDLNQDGNIDPNQFQLPSGLPAGNFVGDAKQFKITVRAKTQSVKQFPGIAFSWFNPKLEKYQTTRSTPIDLNVLDAQIVSAGNVVSAARNGGNSADDDSSDRSLENLALGQAAANFAIATNPQELLGSSQGMRASHNFATVMYVLSFVVVALTLAVRKLGQRDRAELENKNRKRLLTAQLKSAESANAAEACKQIAAAMRELASRGDPAARDTYEAIVADCERIAYAPDPQSHLAEVQGLLRQAQQIVGEAS